MGRIVAPGRGRLGLVMARRLYLLLTLAAAAIVAAPPVAAGPDGPRVRGVGDAVELGVPRAASISWTGIVVDVPVRVRPVGIGGRVERLRFAEMRLNGIAFEVDPYDASFELPAGEAVTLSEPLRLRAQFRNVAPGVIEEALLPSDQLRLTGKVTVDGSFRKWIFSSKRQVEVPIDVTRDNPMAGYHPLRLALEQYRRWERGGLRLGL